MNIWQLWGVDGYEWANPTGGPGAPILGHIFRLRIDGAWTAVHVELVREDGGERFQEADFPWYGSTVIVLRPRVLPVVGALLERHGELLPLGRDDAELLAYNCTTVVDALDHDRSHIKRFPSSGRTWRIDRHVFVEERLRGYDLFRLPDFDLGGPIYVGDTFRDTVLSAGLTGLGFKLVWSDDPTVQIPERFGA